MANTGTVTLALKIIDDEGPIRTIRNLGGELVKAGQRGQKAFNDMERSARTFDKSAKMSAGTMMKMGVGVVGVLDLAKAWGVLKDSVKQYLDLAGAQEAAEQRLGAVLNATGHAAGYNLEQLKAMASGLQQVTKVGDETTLAGMAVLATFEQIRGEAFERTTQVALDMSEVMGKDLNTAMTMLGKAVSDPIEGFASLSRAGVTFTDSQKAAMTAMQESGDLMGAQNIMLKELESKFGGAAEAAAETFHGGLARAANALGDTKEELGFVITKNQFFIELTHMATQVFMEWGQKIQENQSYLMNLAKGGVITLVESLQAGIDVLRFFHNGWLGIKLVGNFAVASVGLALHKLYPILRDLMKPLDAVFKGAQKLGIIDVNPFDALEEGLGVFKDSSADVVKSVIADIEESNRKYDRWGKSIDQVKDKIKDIPTHVVKAANVEADVHDKRMKQIEEQKKAYDALEKNRADAPQKADSQKEEKNLAQKKKSREGELKSLQETNREKYKIEIELAKQVQEDTWLIRDKGLKAAEKQHEETQARITELEYRETLKREEEAAKALEQKQEQQKKEYEEFVKSIEEKTADKLYDLFQRPSEAWKETVDEFKGYFSGIMDRLTDYFHRTLADWAAKAIAEPIIVPFIQQMGSTVSAIFGPGAKSAFGLDGVPDNGASAGGTGNFLFGSLADKYLNTVIPGTTHMGMTPAGMQEIGGTTWGSAIGAGVFSSIGYSTLGKAIGLPQSEYSGFTSGLGGSAMSAYGGKLATMTGLSFLGGPVGIALGAVLGGVLGGLFGKDDPDPRVGVVLGKAPSFAGEGEQTSSAYDYYPWLQDIGNRSATGDAVRTYIDARLNAVDEAFDFSVGDIISQTPGKTIVNPQDYDGDMGRMLSDLEQGLFNILQQGLVEGLQGGLFSHLETDFFKQIALDGEGAFDTFSRFGTVVTETDQFLEKFTRQINEFGETSVSAFENIQTITGILTESQAGIDQITDMGSIIQLESMTDAWKELIQTMEDAHATVEELTQAEKNRDILVGSSITGLNAAGLQSAILSGGDLSQGMDQMLNSLVAASAAEAIAQEYILPINEAVGRVWVETGGDIEAVLAEIETIDLSGVQAEINALNLALGNGLDLVTSNLMNALSYEINQLEKERMVLQDRLNLARENYIAALNEEIDKQREIESVARQTADTFRDLAASLKTAQDDILTTLGVLAPEQESALAKDAYETALKGAWNKDTEAIQALPETARTYLEAAEKILGRLEYRSLVGNVYRQLATVEKIAYAEVTNQDTIAETARTRLNTLETDLRDLAGAARTLVSLKDAADEYHSAALALENSGLDLQIQQHQDSLAELQRIATGVHDLPAAIAAYIDAGGPPVPGIDGGGSGGRTDEDPFVKAAMAYLNANRDVLSYFGEHAGTLNMTAVDFAWQHYEQYGQHENRVWGSFAAGGISTGPKSGYLAELHGTEAVIPLGRGSLPLTLQGGLDTTPLIREIRLLRQAVERQEQSEDKRHFETNRALKTIRDKVIIFDTVGMPERKVS